jgi:hypothetical protein
MSLRLTGFKTLEECKMKTLKNAHRSLSRRLFAEQLEGREMLAAGLLTPPVPVPTPTIQVINQPVAVANVLPGSTGVVMANLNLSTVGHTYAQANEFLFVPAYGSAPLTQNMQNFTLRADLDGNTKNGCEATIGYGTVNYQADTVDFTVNQAVWARPSQSLNIQVVADASTYLTGNVVGMELAFASFTDLRGNQVSDSNVAYVGAPPTLQNLQSAELFVSQQQLPQAVSAYQGNDVDLLRFSASGNNAGINTVTFTASQGNVLNASNYTMTQDANYDGVTDYTYSGNVQIQIQAGKIVPVVNFNLGSTGKLGGTFDVHAKDGNSTSLLQLSFPADGSGLTGSANDTGKPLQGVAPNGNGVGQIRLWANQQDSTLVTTVINPPPVVVTEIPATMPNNVVANAGTNIVTDSFVVAPNVGQKSLTVSHVAIVATQGDVRNLSNYTLWANVGGVNKDIANGFIVNTGNTGYQVWFNPSQVVVPGGTQFEVHADVPSSPAISPFIQTQLSGNQGIGDTNNDALDDFFTNFATEDLFELPGWNSGGLG